MENHSKHKKLERKEEKGQKPEKVRGFSLINPN
jgi:hypothetical protein